MLHEITHNSRLLAIVICHSYQQDGIKFFTPSHFSQQLAYMHHPAGHDIVPHTHKTLAREVTHTQEVLVIRKGRLRVDFYDEGQNYVKSIILEEGDVILLASGGHGFTALEELEMIEIKQGPFAGDKDKSRFDGVPPEQVKIIPLSVTE